MTDEQVQQLNQVAQDVAKKLNSNLGSDNVGKYLVVGEDGNIIVSDGITGENKDNGLDYKITTKVKDNSLIAVLTYTLPEESNPDPNPEYDNLNNIAISGKTYKEIFVDGNLLLGTDFEDRLDNFIINSGNPKLSTDYYVSPTHSLKCFGNTSQQYRSKNQITITSQSKTYIALKARCDRYNKGQLGYNDGAFIIGAQSTTNGFETFSSIASTNTGLKTVFIGSYNSADLDGYIDDIVLINLTNIFGTGNEPEKEELDAAYENYISIIASSQDVETPELQYSSENTVNTQNNKTEEYILSYQKHVDHTDQECINAFMDLVNGKSEYYGMTKSSFTSPSGAGGNMTCAKDLAIAGCYACGYKEILDIWKHKNYKINVYGNNHREISVESTVMNTPVNSYIIYGGKTGSWSGTENLLVISDVNGDTFSCVVMDCGSSSNRFVAMGELLDVIAASSGEVSTATAACVYKISKEIPQLHNVSEENTIYAKNETQEIIPASVTKVMTAMTAIDYADSLSEKIIFKSSDLESGSGAIFQTGDVLTLKDALVAMLLPSSNMAAKAVARNIGKKYLDKFEI